jgi:hypothetical protein
VLQAKPFAEKAKANPPGLKPCWLPSLYFGAKALPPSAVGSIEERFFATKTPLGMTDYGGSVAVCGLGGGGADGANFVVGEDAMGLFGGFEDTVHEFVGFWNVVPGQPVNDI